MEELYNALENLFQACQLLTIEDMDKIDSELIEASWVLGKYADIKNNLDTQAVKG